MYILFWKDASIWEVLVKRIPESQCTRYGVHSGKVNTYPGWDTAVRIRTV